MVSTFARWYLSKLKANPLATNMSSAFLLMTVGDLLAQQLETHAQSEQSLSSSTSSSSAASLGSPRSEGKSISVRSSDADIGQHAPVGSMAVASVVDEQSSSLPSTPSNANVSAIGTINETGDSRWSVVASSMITSSQATMAKVSTSVKKEIEQWDSFRTGTMVAWSVGAYTPLFMVIYKMYDKHLPKKTPRGIAARVGLNLALSFPVNAAFYMYGTSVQHVAGQMALQQERKQDTIASSIVDFQLDLNALRAKCWRKIDAELTSTIIASSQFWIPVNMVTFAAIPSHLQPLSVMFFSLFWNCYLSLSQHRHVPTIQQQQQRRQQRQGDAIGEAQKLR
uniref:Peroxisomal membrane protein MPV17 n=1 Tax=Craspedostauros australis TaxID=1486917 RepID=A0A7R9ZN21_9STRA|mmetsp:Transcript_21409/g.59570  ORF Transcript_21409/g.59570 Transcript_21409/m.59570 type:complete len:338 (+) Transcript_21409:319-1332(+)|eukprot:CAMPEP_0198118352 /NCGR_PEP_ID=MMETSP1442-20131203/21321_1 /TAXON_ID= /ORGANISM="Craspedostauros australis, Strain CCMP3328" /LENGTH=337 /DNA_ID=CAMNT_0043776597 /DNA_START=283 /DNA_END=1296 /DNA_ORIENTATION=-